MPSIKKENRTVKFSIIVASYNYGNFIKETLESILNQTYKSYEVIVVDDGSKDNSVEVIKSYTNKYDNFYLYTHENNSNKGLAETIKLGISKSKGEYICFCESDDYWAADHLEEKYNYIMNNNADFVINDITLVGNVNNDVRWYIDLCLKNLRTITDLKGQFGCLEENNKLIPTFSIVTIKKEIIEKLNFNSPIKPWLDWWLWRQVCGKHQIGFIDKKLTCWRIHNSYNKQELDKHIMMIPEFVKKSDALIAPFAKYFSVKTRNNHKVVTILGIKFKSKLKVSTGSITEVISEHYRGKRAPKILVISHEFSYTGAPKVALILSTTLKKLYGISPVVISLKDGPIKKDFLKEGIFVLDTTERKFDQKFIEEVSPCFDCIIFHSWVFELFGQYDNMKYSPIIWYCHEDFSNPIYIPCFDKIRETIETVTLNLAGSPVTKKTMEDLCPDKVIDTLLYGSEDLANGTKIPKRVDDKLTFLFPATIEPRKGHAILVEAVKSLPLALQQKSKFILIGKQGCDNPSYENFLQSIEGVDCIEYINEVDFDTLMDIYKKVDSIVVPSTLDPMPMVATYGFMFKKLCVLSNSIGTATLVNDGENAVLFESGNSSDLARKLEDIISHYENYQAVAINGRKVYEKNFSIDVFKKKIKKYVSMAVRKNQHRKFKIFVENHVWVKDIDKHRVVYVLGLKLKFKSKKLLKELGIDKNSCAEDVFSVKNHGQHKVISILGLKLKFKSKKLADKMRMQALEFRCNALHDGLQEQACRCSELNEKISEQARQHVELNEKFREQEKRCELLEKGYSLLNSAFCETQQELKYYQSFNAETNDFVDYEQNSCDPASDLKLIAFYLPQFHTFKENEEWHGRGFTEWTNVTKAFPMYDGHLQPQLPIDVGFYDLSTTKVMYRQIELAKNYGLHGFCFHYYWFSGKRLMETPMFNYLSDKKLDFPFCLCWANENWSKKWDGGNNEVLIEQSLQEGDGVKFANDIAQFLRDERYIKVDNKPLLVIYRPSLFEHGLFLRFVDDLRQELRNLGVGEVHLVMAKTFGDTNLPEYYNLDAVVEFPPHAMNNSKPVAMHQYVNPYFKGVIWDMEDYINNEKYLYDADYTLYKTVFPNWDNTPRRGYEGSIFETSPELYKKWLKGCIKYTLQHNDKQNQLVFINAWNKWAEGAHLEPDRRNGYAYLQATKKALEEANND